MIWLPGYLSFVVSSTWSFGLTLNCVLRVFLSVVTMISGVGKLMDPDGNRQALSDFGLPSKWVSPAAKTLPALELVLSLGLLIDATARFASACLTVLFLGFCLGIFNLVRQDKAPPCNCFGAVHSEPVSWATLARTGSLALLALVCTSLPQSPLSSTSRVPAILTIYAVVSILFVKLIQHRIERGVYKKTLRLGVGQRLPALRLEDGRWLESALPSGTTLLIATAKGCLPCKILKEKLSDWAAVIADDLSIVELRLADEEEEGVEADVICHTLDHDSFSKLLVRTPGGILVDQSGTIIEPPVNGSEEIMALMRVFLSD